MSQPNQSGIWYNESPTVFTNDYLRLPFFLQCSVIPINYKLHHSHTSFICVLFSRLPKQ